MHKSLVLTTINSPTEGVKLLAEGAIINDFDFIIVGDRKTPSDFTQKGVTFYDLKAQAETGIPLVDLCPYDHYSRKNIGYLIAINNGSDIIVETDDDNYPYDIFWDTYSFDSKRLAPEWSPHLNIYKFFTERRVWPRGFPLELINNSFDYQSCYQKNLYTPIVQGLADLNPDVDAIYRLTSQLPISFEKNKSIALPLNSYCAFNSQNTSWHKDVFPLLYLPSYCSFRMTDIWRSFIAERIIFEFGWSVLFTSPTVYQERNEHDLISDFTQEIEGYRNNYKIIEGLRSLKLSPNPSDILINLKTCYTYLCDKCYLPIEELVLVDRWILSLEGKDII